MYDLIGTKIEGVDLEEGFYLKLLEACVNTKYIRLIPFVIWKFPKHDIIESLEKSLCYAFKCFLLNRENFHEAFYFLLMFVEIKKGNTEFIQHVVDVNQFGNNWLLDWKFEQVAWSLRGDDLKKLRFVAFIFCFFITTLILMKISTN